MHRIDGPGATADNKFTSGNASTGVAATQVTPEWLTAVQEEIAGAIVGLGGTLSKADNAQLLEAIKGSRSITANGYLKLASGLIIQWGVITIASGTTSTVASHPIAFPNACFGAVANRSVGAANPDANDVISLSATTTTLTIRALGTVGATRSYVFIVLGN